MRAGWLVAVSIGRCSIAAAQPVPVEDALRTPGWVTLDRLDANSRIGAELSVGGGAGLRSDLHGHYVDPSTGLGGYLAMPFATEAFDASTTRIGNLELGGMWMTQLGRTAGLVVRAGIVAPTSSDQLESKFWVSRVADKAATLGGTTTVRLSASPTVRHGNVFGRLDLGVDVVVDAPYERESMVRVQPGLGVSAHRVAFMAELALVHGNSIAYEHRSFDASIALSTRITTETLQPYFAILLPRGDKVAFTLGIDGVL